MVVTPLEITTHSAVRPRIVMLWVFFLVTIVVVGPTVPASAFVSCTWHHGQLPGEHPETLNDSKDTSSGCVVRAAAMRISRESFRNGDDSEVALHILSSTTPQGNLPAGISLRGPPANR